MTTVPLPAGFRLVRDRHARPARNGTVVWGGTPLRVLRLTSAGAARGARLLAGEPVVDQRDGLLARRLLDAGLAHPVPPQVTSPEPEVVVPAFDRLDDLDRCLASLKGLSVTVVDDASQSERALRQLVTGHGARVIRHHVNGGPAAARNAGLAATTGDVVAFVDSDCVIGADALRLLARHLADPAVAAAAPRIDDRLLDLGDRSALVRPGGAVPYVPATTLVVRRTAVAGGFDESLRYGEDVDFVWRLVEGGWSVRYDATVVAEHRNGGFGERMSRSYRYGTSVGPLARRHPATLNGPAIAGLWAPMRTRMLARSGVPVTVAMRTTAVAPLRTATGLVTWALPMSAEKLAYAAGVWRGCAAAQTVQPLLPRLR